MTVNNNMSFNKENILTNIDLINNIFQTHYNEHKNTIVTIYNSGYYPLTENQYSLAKIEFRFPIEGLGEGCLAHCSDDDIYYNLTTKENKWINDLYEILNYYIDFNNPENINHGFSLNQAKEIIELPVSAVIEFLKFLTGGNLETNSKIDSESLQTI